MAARSVKNTPVKNEHKIRIFYVCQKGKKKTLMQIFNIPLKKKKWLFGQKGLFVFEKRKIRGMRMISERDLGDFGFCFGTSELWIHAMKKTFVVLYLETVQNQRMPSVLIPLHVVALQNKRPQGAFFMFRTKAWKSRCSSGFKKKRRKMHRLGKLGENIQKCCWTFRLTGIIYGAFNDLKRWFSFPVNKISKIASKKSKY